MSTQPIDRAGDFRGEIFEYGIREFESGSIGVTFTARLDEYWNGQEWEDWRQYGFYARGTSFVIKKTGETNQPAVDALVKCAGWDGTFSSIDNRTWKPVACQFSVGPNEYKGETTYRVDFLNEYDRQVGQASNVDSAKAKALDAKYGSSLRAIVGTAKRNAAPASGKPMPKPAPAKSAAPSSLPPRGEPAPQDEIPF